MKKNVVRKLLCFTRSGFSEAIFVPQRERAKQI